MGLMTDVIDTDQKKQIHHQPSPAKCLRFYDGIIQTNILAR